MKRQNQPSAPDSPSDRRTRGWPFKKVDTNSQLKKYEPDESICTDTQGDPGSGGYSERLKQNSVLGNLEKVSN